MFALKKPAKTDRKIEFQCQECFTEFCLISWEISCPNCGSRDLNQMVIIYADDDPDIHEMMTDADIGAGD